MISVEGLSKNFGHTEAVKDISFTVNAGETLVLLGTSGCGKTTTLKMVNRLIEASAGEIRINGESIFHQKPEELRRNIGYVSQNDGLFPHYSVLENMSVVPKLLGWDKKQTTQKAAELSDRLRIPLKEFGHKLPATLSGGQKQRVAIVRALIADQPVLLMDEPFGALDPVTRAEVRREFLELPEFRRKTTVMVTHDIQEAFELADHICLMDRGRIVQAGTAKDLLFKPANAFVSGFFEHQRMFLELSALRIYDVWDLLDPVKTVESDVLNAEMNLWEVMELFSATDARMQVFRNGSGGFRSVDVGQVQSVYHRFKKL